MRATKVVAMLCATLLVSTASARDGNYITSWAENGRLVLDDITLFFDQAPISHVEAGGSMLIAGICYDENWLSRRICILKYNKDAEPEASFGQNGFVGISGSGISRVSALTAGSDGRIYLTANRPSGEFGNLLMTYRVWPDGFHHYIEDSYGLHFDSSTSEPESYASAIAVTNNNYLVVAGMARTGTSTRTVAFARLHHSFLFPPDISFGSSGVALVPEIPTGSSYPNGIRNIHLLDDGKIVAVGVTGGNSSMQPYVLRLNADGSLDQSFGHMGVAMYPEKAAVNTYNAITSDSEGRLITTGSFSIDYPLGESSRIARFTESGSPDLTFGIDGEVIFNGGDLARPMESGSLISIQSDEKIIIAGIAQAERGPEDLKVVITRHHPDGTLDSGFGSDGRVLREFYDSTDPNFFPLQPQIASSMQILDDQLIIGGGIFYGSDSGIPAFMRLNNDTIFDGTFD